MKKRMLAVVVMGFLKISCLEAAYQMSSVEPTVDQQIGNAIQIAEGLAKSLSQSYFDNFNTSERSFNPATAARAFHAYSLSLHPDRQHGEVRQDPEFRQLLAKFGVIVPQGILIQKEDVKKANTEMLKQKDVMLDYQSRLRYSRKKFQERRAAMIEALNDLVAKMKATKFQQVSLADLNYLEDKLEALSNQMKLESPEDFQAFVGSYKLASDLYKRVDLLSKTGLSRHLAQRAGQVDIAKARTELIMQENHIGDALNHLDSLLQSYAKRPDKKYEYEYYYKLYEQALSNIMIMEQRLESDPSSVKVEDIQEMVRALQEVSHNLYGKGGTYQSLENLEKSRLGKASSFIGDVFSYFTKKRSKKDFAIAPYDDIKRKPKPGVLTPVKEPLVEQDISSAGGTESVNASPASSDRDGKEGFGIDLDID